MAEQIKKWTIFKFMLIGFAIGALLAVSITQTDIGEDVPKENIDCIDKTLVNQIIDTCNDVIDIANECISTYTNETLSSLPNFI